MTHPSDTRQGPRFERRVFALVRRVPPGVLVTYGQVAALLRVPRAARAVGQAMRRCAPGVSWHRVVNGQGRISLRPNLEGMVRQRLLLEQEGVRFARGRIDLRRYRWSGRPPRSVPAALAALNGQGLYDPVRLGEPLAPWPRPEQAKDAGTTEDAGMRRGSATALGAS